MSATTATTDDGPRCGTCAHFRPLPRDPADLMAAPRGECREGPPAAAITPNGRGGVNFHAFYPMLGPDFNGCGHYKVRPEA